MRIITRLVFCFSTFCLLAPAADCQQKSKSSKEVAATACAISVFDSKVNNIAGNLQPVKDALNLDITIPLWNTGKDKELEALYQKAIVAARKKLGPNSVAEAAVQQALGDLYVQKSNYKDAEPAFCRGIEILQMPPNVKSNREILADCYEGMGYVYDEKKQYDKALFAFKKWLSIMDAEGELASDPNSERYAMGLDRVASVYVRQKNYKAAEPLIKKSLAMRKKTYGENGSTTNYVKERLAEVYEGMNKSAEIAKINNSLIESKKKQLGPELGQFFAKCALDTASSKSILPMVITVGPGAKWNQDLFTKAIHKKLGSTPEDASWYKIPNWYAGLWGDIPKGVKVKETDGVLWTDPPPMGFYSGPGPFATRKGFIRAKNGWWHYDADCEQSGWTQSSRADSKNLVYIYYQNLAPVTIGDGSLKFTTVVMNFEVKPKKAFSINDMSPIFSAGTVVRVWQENRISIYQQLGPSKFALYSVEKLYDWNGKELATRPEGNKVSRNGSASWQKKVGEAKAVNFTGRNLKQELKQFLTNRRLSD